LFEQQTNKQTNKQILINASEYKRVKKCPPKTKTIASVTLLLQQCTPFETVLLFSVKCERREELSLSWLGLVRSIFWIILEYSVFRVVGLGKDVKL
jgi:hypothetical protein